MGGVPKPTTVTVLTHRSDLARRCAALPSVTFIAHSMRVRQSLAILMLATSFTDHTTAWAAVAAGVGTVGTLGFLLYQLRGERNRRRATGKEAQALRVSGWIGSDWMHQTEATETHRIELLNASGEPVYRAVVHLVFVQGGPETGREMDEQHHGRFRQSLLVIPPGRYYIEVPPAFHHMHRRHGVEMAFTDRAGVHWLRTSDGRLEEIKQTPTDYYGLPLPIDWASPEEVGASQD
jgi:hypothetical protein